MPTLLVRPLTTPEEVRAELGNKDTAIDEKILISINTTSRALERVTGRHWGIYDLTLAAPLLGYLDAGLWHCSDSAMVAALNVDLLNDGPELFLPLAPVHTMTSVTEDETALTLGTDYLVDRRMGVLRKIPGSPTAVQEVAGALQPPRWGKRVTIVCKLGYEVADVSRPAADLPGDLRMAATKIAAAWTGENRREQVTFDGRRLPFVDKAVPADAYRLLKPYIRSNA